MEEQTYIQAINIKKIRHLENVDIVISEDKMKHLILTGKNGSGKTSVLVKTNLNLNGLKNADIKDLAILFNDLRPQLNQGFKLKVLVTFFDTLRKLNLNKSTGVKDEVKSTVEDFEKFLAKKKTEQAFLSFEKSEKEKVDQITAWFDHLENKLQYLFEDDSLRLITKRNQDVIEFYLTSDHREDFDFNTLSSGYSSILLILFDIIQQMDNDVSIDYTKEGIVLIDEIETHLHVSLQKKILPFLTGFFPNVQFIVTTHSPFVLQSEPNAVIFDLETKKRYENFSNYSSESILETFYNMDKFSQSLKDKMHDYEQMLSSNQYKNGKKTEFLALRNMFLNITDIEIDYWLKDLELKYIHDIKALMQ